MFWGVRIPTSSLTSLAHAGVLFHLPFLGTTFYIHAHNSVAAGNSDFVSPILPKPKTPIPPSQEGKHLKYNTWAKLKTVTLNFGENGRTRGYCWHIFFSLPPLPTTQTIYHIYISCSYFSYLFHSLHYIKQWCLLIKTKMYVFVTCVPPLPYTGLSETISLQKSIN